MKKIVFLLLLPLLSQSQIEVSSSKSNWLTNYATALEASKAEHKNLLIYFTGSDWCPPCKILQKDFFETSAFLDQADNYVLLYVDLPRRRGSISSDLLLHNKKLMSRWNNKKVFPFLVIIDENEKRLGELAGYAMNGNIKKHTKLINKYIER
ncbi:thioredoxin family protein [Pareuzebyella sediminis]|uniref:thioredoxin family protein n=1 Tax=Pareuzebyella sediminis TaxID=2607998 RepID=UPI0011EE27DF|nr:thioredoxin family protein [Pareuzebyella sediminis]